MLKTNKFLAKIGIVVFLLQFALLPFSTHKASAAAVALTPLNSVSAAEMTTLNALINASIPPGPQNQAFITSLDYTPTLSPDSSTPSSGTVTEDVVADQDPDVVNAKVYFAPFDAPDIPLCATDVVVKGNSSVAINGSNYDTDGNAAASMAFFDPNDMSWLGAANSLITHSYATPLDYGSPAVDFSFTSNPITAAQYNSAKFYLAMDGSAASQDPVVHRLYDWKNVYLDVTYDDSACAQADLKVTTTITSGATTILPGKCELVEVKLENLGPDDSSSAGIVLDVSGDAANTTFMLNSQPTAPSGASQEINGDDITTITPTTAITAPALYTIDNIPAAESVVLSLNVCASSSATAGQSLMVGGYEAGMDSVIDPDLSNNDNEAKLLVATVPTTPTTTTPTTTTLPAAGNDLVVSVLISIQMHLV
jgi:hypothetical protein